MKKLFFLIAILSAALFSKSETLPVFTNEDLSITPIGDGTWVVETADKTTMYLLEGSESPLALGGLTGPMSTAIPT